MNGPTPSSPFQATARHDRAAMLGMLAAASHLLLLLVIQLENYTLSLWPANHSLTALLSFAAGLVLAQWENIAVALVLGGITLLISAARPGRWLSFSMVILANLYLVIDQVGFKLFFDHFDPSMLEGTERLGDLRSSVTGELDGAFFLNLMLLVVIGRRLYTAFFDPAGPQRLPHAARLVALSRSSAVRAMIAALLVTGLLFPVRPNYIRLYHHPFHNLVLSLYTPSPGESPDAAMAAAASGSSLQGAAEDLDLRRLRFGTTSRDAQSEQQLAAALQAARGHPPMNVLWIVLESVGSKQLLTSDGRPDPAVTPNLARLSQHAVLFNSLYSVYPGTARSHVDMATGGRTLTWGSVFNELSHAYRGPTMARAFSSAGYDTALFSAQKLDFENLNGFYKHAGFDYYYDFGEADAQFQEQNTLQSWGAKEGPVMALAAQWLDQRRDRSRPFFLQYLTVATHHPYDVPADFRRPVQGTSREDNYRNALAYTDDALGVLLSQLQTRGLLDNTLIVVNGDHGEAFGTFHPQDFLHKNYIYEENIKNFLLIANPELFPQPVVSPRLGSIGDIMPTLLALTRQAPADVPGQNLLAPDYAPRLVFFYKNAIPVQWGLRDGQWKYIAEMPARRAQLYNLNVDRDEANNLARSYPDRVALYDKLAARWFVQTNHDFVSRLENFRYPGGSELSDADMRSAGPKLITFGYQTPGQGNGDARFIEAAHLNPYEQVVAWTQWVSYPRERTVQYVWQAPNGDRLAVDFKLQPTWTTTVVNNAAPLPLQEGEWRLSIKDGDQTLLTGSFIVDGAAPLHVQRDKPGSPNSPSASTP